MKEVTVSKASLIEALRQNLNRHTLVFEEALAGYKDKAIALLEKSLADARAGKRVLDKLYIPVPVNQSFEYRRAIKMLEMSVEETVKLTTQEFDAYVMDRWHWKQAFLTSNSVYSATATQELEREEEE